MGIESEYIELDNPNGGKVKGKSGEGGGVTVRYMRNGALMIQLMLAVMYGWLGVYVPLNFMDVAVEYGSNDTMQGMVVNVIKALALYFPWILLGGLIYSVILTVIGYHLIPRSLVLPTKERPYIVGEKIIGWSFACGIFFINISGFYFLFFLDEPILFTMSMSTLFAYGLAAAITLSFELNE